MYPVEETELAGIGRRFVVVTNSGSQLVIVVHDESGAVELYCATSDDPQKTCPVATLTDDEARLVAAIIGSTIYRPEAIERLAKHDVIIRWHALKAQSYAIGKTVGEVFENTGIAVLTIVDKEGKRQTSPPKDYVFQEGSQIALSGTRKNIEKVGELIDKGQ